MGIVIVSRAGRLSIRCRRYGSEEWQGHWQLYCHQRLAVGDRLKLFESDYVSFPLDGGTQ